MARTRVSSKFQVVIPKKAREQVGLKEGQELAVIVKGGIVSLVPIRPLKAMQGFAKGMKDGGIREKKDRM